MFRARISVATQSLGLPLRRAIEFAMECRAGGVQFDLRNQLLPRDFGDTARRQLLHELRERDLEPASGTFRLRSPLASQSRLDERLQAIRQAITFAAQLKIRLLTIRPGRIPSTEQAAERDMLIAIVSDLATHGNREGVVLGLLPSGDSADRMLPFVESIRTGPVVAVADVASWALSGQSVSNQMRTLHAVIGHIEVRDAVRDQDGTGKEVPVGRGEIDWDEVAGLLEEMGYSAWLNVDRTSGAHPDEDIANAVKYLQNLLPT